MAFHIATEELVLVDGRPCPDGRVSVFWRSPGLAGGVGAFETLAIRDRRAPTLEAHLRRLVRSCALLGLPAPELSPVRQAVSLLRAQWPQPNGVLRIQCLPSGQVITAVRGAGPPRAHVRACFQTWPSPPFPPARAKHTSRGGAALATRHLAVDEVLRVDASGEVLEGTWSNVFRLSGRQLHTCPNDGRILPGITRQLVLRLAPDLGLECVEAAPRASVGDGHWFLTSSLSGVVAVAVLDHAPQPPPPSILTALQAALAVCDPEMLLDD